jgi:hypothetical protein
VTDLVERLRASVHHDVRVRSSTSAEAADEIERLRGAAKPFAEHDWYDAELEDDNCQLVRHSGPITVGHWRALRAALGMKP